MRAKEKIKRVERCLNPLQRPKLVIGWQQADGSIKIDGHKEPFASEVAVRHALGVLTVLCFDEQDRAL